MEERYYCEENEKDTFKHEVNVTCDSLETLTKDVVIRICE